MAEELLLQRDAVVRIEMRPVFETVALQPFLLGGGAHEASKLPRGCRPWPPQFAAENSGTFTFDQSGMRDCQYSSVSSFRARQSS
jgi:hypothetical protein